MLNAFLFSLINNKGIKGWWHDFPIYVVFIQLWHLRHFCKQSFIIFKLPNARLFMARRLFLYFKRTGIVFNGNFINCVIYFDIRPIPIAISIFLTVSLAMALAFSAPSSKILSNSSELMSSLKRS